MANNRQKLGGVLLAAATLFAVTVNATLTKKSDVRNSKHNLSATATDQAYAPTRTPGWVATSETQICVFCHTPHGATSGVNPLWNKQLSSATYSGYTASSLDAATIQAGFNGQPAGSSKLCLSCHDGTMAVNNVNVLNAATNVTIGMTNSTFAGAPGPYTASSGFTANIGSDLTNDHPISVDFTNALALRDGELRVVSNDALQQWQSGGVDIIRKRGVPGVKPVLPLAGTGAGGTGQVQCISCHDPHIVDTDTTKGDQMFLRLNRFQDAAAGTTYTKDNDIICLGCHDKDKGAGAYVYSSHANSLVATQTYTAGAVTPRQFPAALPVWKASCVNCHQGHTVPGAAHLLSEGSTAGLVGGLPFAGGTRQGAGVKAQENTCYQCHTLAANSVVASTNPLIDIEGTMKGTGVGAGNTFSHPNVATTETHDTGGNFNDGGFADCTGATNKCGADGIEQRSKLGLAALGNRHAECTDCHNPHRVAKVRSIADDITGAGYVAGGAHRHEDATGYVHDNIASGVLRGTWGVEPVYTNSAACRSFHADPNTCISYTVKRGDPGLAPSTLATATYVTREYQVCLKCHSNYGYTDDNAFPSGASRPLLGWDTRLTASAPDTRANYTRFSNQAKEFQAPSTHQGEFNGKSLGTEAGSRAAGNTNNARSWHPVIGPTGRSARGTYKVPWNNAGARGVQTMYCSDCHGTTTASATSVIPDNRLPTAAHGATSDSWGPHGGNYKFMLKGTWCTTSEVQTTCSSLCLKCHTPTGTTPASGFGGGNGHGRGGDHDVRCSNCHIANVHGWKGRALMVNLADLGPEDGRAVGTSAPSTPYSSGPYYMAARLRILTWRASGAWANKSDCTHTH